MVLAARLLQYGASGKDVARVVGCTAPEISRAKAELLAMAVEPMSDTEAEQLIGKNKPFKPEPGAPEIEEAAETAAEIREEIEAMNEKIEEMAEEDQTIAEPPLLAVQQSVMVNIDIGQGKVCLEAEDERIRDVLCAMLAVVREEQTKMLMPGEPVTNISIDIGRGKAKMEIGSLRARDILTAMLSIMAEDRT